jgi:polysaccharide export outer membrane protein
MSIRFKWSWALLAALILGSGCQTVKPITAAQAEMSAPTATVSSPEEIKQNESILGIGDTVDVDVYRHADLKRSLRIDENGKIDYPLIGNIQVAGLSVTTFKNKLRDELSKFIVDPQVTVAIRGMHAQKVYVLGEVTKPGIFTIEEPMTALEAISQAGGFTTDAKDQSVMLIRGDKTNPQLVKLDLESVLKKANLGENIELRGGDVLYVPPTFIADVSRFSVYLRNILAPILMVEQGIVQGDQVQNIFRGKQNQGGTNVIINVP